MPRRRSSHDEVNGSNRSEFIATGRGNDTINAGGGNDWVFAGSGNDEVNAGSGNDVVVAGSGNDQVDGGSGNDLILGGSGADTIDGGDGSDAVYAGSGNDTLIYTMPQGGNANSCWWDNYDGGSGIDTLQINLTAEQFADPALQAELSAYLDALEAGTAPRCVWLSSLNLAVSRIELVEIYVDGVLTDPRDPGGSIIAEDDSFTVSEEGTLADDVGANDTAPAGATFTLLTPVTGGTLVLNADGTFTFDPNGDFEALAEGETTTQSFTYQISSGGETATATATITITGTNDAPTVSAAVAATVSEDASTTTIDLLQGASDVDNGAVLSVANITGLIPGVSLSGNALVVDPSEPSLQALASGETLDVTISYDVVDEFGASVPQTATITITGANDAPTVAGAVSGTATEDGAAVTIDLLQGAADVDASAVLSVNNLSPLPAGATLSGTDLILDPSDAAYQSLAAGETLDVSVTYDVTDEFGATVPQTATITITGTNDAPTVTGAITQTMSEDDPALGIDLLQGAADVDASDTLSIANVTGLVTGVTLAGSTLTVDASDPSIQALGVGESLDVTVTYDIVDGNGGSVSQTATITITGANDAPTVAAVVTASAAEDDATFSVDLLAGASDPDSGDTLNVVNVSPLPAGVTLVGNSLSVDPSDAAFQSLAMGDALTLTVTYDVEDGNGGSTSQSAEITITGTNDAPTVSAAITAGAEKNDPVFSVDLLEFASDVDSGTVLSVANVTGLTAGVTLVGTTLSVDPSDPAFAGLAPGDSLEITVSFDVIDGDGGSVPQTATITVIGANEAPVVTGPILAGISEDAASGVDIDLLAGASDPDGTAPLTVENVSSLPTGFSLSGTTLTVDPSGPSYQALAVGESVDLVVTYDIVDEFGASVAQTATITIIGANDAPTVAAALTATAAEDDAPFAVDLLDGAFDVDLQGALVVQNVSGLQAGVTVSGSTLNVDPSDPAFQALALGDSLAITVSYEIADDQGATVPQTATITLTGTNDAPTVAAALTASADEDDASIAINLLTGASDVDNGAVLSVANVSALPAGLSLTGSTLTVDPADASFQSLAVGDTLDLTVTYDVQDEHGATVPQTATITITGTNDAPTVAAALTAAANEDDASFALDLLSGASDADSGTVLSLANVSALPAGVSLTGSTLTVDPADAAFQSLAVGETQAIVVSYDVTDGDGGSVSQTATITITGTNDAPVVSASLAQTAAEDDASFSLDLLANASDVDASDVLSVANVTGLGNGLTLAGSTLTVDPAHPSLQSLNLGDELTLTVTYDVVDGNGGVTPTQAQITITGTNDTPTVAAALTASANEDDASFTVDLLSGASDVDSGALLSVANVSVLPAGLSLSGSTLTVDPSDASFQPLALGETQEITVTFDVQDEHGATVPQTATITITGTNDAPTVAAALTAAADEDDASFTVDLLSGASDVDNGAVLSVQNVSSLPAGVSLAGSVLTVDPADAAFQPLALGETQNILIDYEVTDEHGAFVPQTATITITGTNDSPTVAAALTASADEDDASFSINLLTGASDVDNGAVLSVANVSVLPAGLSVSGSTLTVDPSDASFQSLALGDTLDLTVTYEVTDEHGATVPQTATITITGTNDAPTVAAALTAAADEDDASFTVDLLSGASDVDNGAVLSVTNVSALPDGLSLLGSTLTVDPSDASLQSLALGETLDLIVTYDVEDEHGASVPQTATITITGTNDAPTVAAALSDTVFEDDPVLSIDLLDGAADVDNGAVLSVANVTGLAAGFTLNGTTL